MTSLAKHKIVFMVGMLAAFLWGGTALAAEMQARGPLSGTLKDSVQATLEYNPNVKAFQEYRQAAEFDLKRARSGWLPQVNARAGFGFEQWDDSLTRSGSYAQDDNTLYRRFDGAIILTQTLWDGLATSSRYGLSDARLSSAVFRLYDNAEAISLDALLAHMEIYRQRRLVELSELNVKNHRSILNSQETRQRAGASSRADVTQTQGRLARAESSLTDARLALATALANYKMLTGRDAGDLGRPYAPGAVYPSLESAIAESQKGNPKVQALSYDVEANRSQRDLDLSTFSPTIYLEIGPQYRWQVESSDTYAWGTGIMLRANWNLYNGHYDWYNVKGDKARIRQSQQELAALRDSVASEATATWSQLLASREQVRFYTSAVQYNTQTRDMYLQQFNVGQRSLLDVLDSENELYNSSMLLVTAQQTEIATQYKLLALGGGLLKNFDINRENLKVATDGRDFQDDDPSK